MEYLNIVVNYVEGRMSFEEFDAVLCENEGFVEWFEHMVPANWKCHTRAAKENDFIPEELPFTVHQMRIEESYGHAIGSLPYQVNMHSMMKSFLQEVFPNIEIHPCFPNEEMYYLTLDACPDYIDGTEISQEKVIENIVRECDGSWSRTKKVKYIKDRIKEVFHIEGRKHPQWVQNPEWPMMNGKPMKFVKTTVKVKYEWYQHHFIDPETGEEHVVDDMY